ncbi:MAG: SDR family NAD(P)-dependent oxidoreductase [Spirochaetales bacterium]|nr:SDR family NAD(P)-dependent oxidoreductase [Spirochaetales bacterium]
MISPRDTLLHDHEIAGETILPGASMIEMVYSSLAEKTNDTISLLEFIIHNPFIIKEKSIVDIEINQQEKLVRLKTDDTLLCMSHYHCNEKRDNDNEYRLPVPEITQCGQFPVDGLYTLFKKKGYHYGDSLQVITGIWILDERIIFEIKDKNKNGKSFISPALMDGILQTILFIAFDFQKERWDTPGMMFIPHKIESLYIHHPLVDTIYVELPLGTIEKNDKDLIFTARAFNREGTCLATADRIHFKQVYNNFLSLHDISLYTPAWQKKEVNSHNTSGTDKIRALFFGDIDDTVLKQHIAGDDYDSVMMVHHGKEYRENSATEVTINPGRQSDYFKLLDMILERNRTQDLDLFYIVTEPGRTGDYDFLNYFFHLCRALMAGNNDLKIKMIVITRDSRITVDSDRGTNFSQNSIVGFSKTLMKENPSIKIKVLDMDKGMAHDRLLQISIAEMKSEFDSPLVVYRDGARYIQKYRKMSFAATPGSMIKEKGVYCIAGGLGGIGFHLVSDMAKNFDIHMILLGRSALTGEIEQKINQLSRFNSHINYFQTDITNREEVKKTIDSIVETYGTIDGIIHAAGVIKDAWFIRKEWKDFAAVAAPKIQGTCYLNELTSHLKLDFFVVFSSIVSLTGNIGQIDYTAANSFIDSFIQYRKKNNYPGKSLGINWSLWSGTGMGKNKKAEMQLAGMGIEPLTVKQGLGGFYHALANTEGQVVIINGRNETFLQPYLEGKENTAAPVIPGHEDNNEVKEKEIDGEKLHDYLVGIFSEKSGCPPEDIDDETSFFNLGIDSIIIEDVMGLLDKKFEKLSTTLLFEHSHMKSLVEYLKTKKPKVNDFYHHNEPGNDTDRETDKNETGIQVNSILTTSSQSAPWPYPGAGKEDKGYDIAVIGMWGKFPLSPGLDEYWDNLVKGADCIEEIPGERWDYKKYFDPDIHAYNKTYGKWGGFIKDIDKFDPAYFGISPREAAEMDPQQRLLLECACEMMERAGYGDPDIYKDNLIGLFAGVMWNEYSVLGTQDGFMQNIYPGPGTLYWAIANRVSYIMDLRGPSIALDTACSSSLVAIDLACQSILRGDCHMAIAGGVNLNLHPSKYIYLGQAKFLSTDGRCRSFGKGGNGYVPGEGVGTILLKPLEKAIDDKDTIYGIVRGSATNHGGKAAGFTVPDVEAQSKVIVKAFERARIKAEDIGYIEAHGTGTSLGDPIEIKGITKAFEKYTGEKQFCPIGSVKSNIGHLEAASGIAGVIKILLSFKNHCIPKSIHNDELNPNIDFTDTPFFVVKENLEWQEKENKPLAAGISSFGAGGSNAHIILESFESENPQASSSGEGHLIVLSARSPVQLKEYAEKLLGYLEAFNKNEVIPLSGIAYTLQTGRKKMEERLAVHCYSIEDLMKKLTSYLADEPVGSVYYDNIKNHKKGLREIQKHEAGEAMLDDWIRSKDYHSLARYWVKGIKVEWRNLYGNNGMRKVSLPAYPFARERYWIPGGTGQTQIKGDGMNPLHPLLHRNISTLYEQLFSLVINPDDYFVNHHKVNKKKIVPGACYLEMANVAGIYSSQVMVRKITDVSWISAIVVNGSPAEVFTKIIPGENFLEYTIFTGDGKNQRIHGKGRMEMGEEATGEKEIVHYSELMHRLSNSINKESCYSYFKRIGLDYGNSFRVIAHASYNENEVLATLALPGNMEDAKNEWVINPFIIDAAFQSTLLPLKAGNELKTMCVPVSVKEITIFHTLNNLNYKSYAVRKPCNPRSSVYAFDIIIFDEDGMVCIKMEDLAIKQIQDFKNLKQENQPGTELEQNEIKAVNYV